MSRACASGWAGSRSIATRRDAVQAVTPGTPPPHPYHIHLTKFAIVEAPSVLGLRPTGVEDLPDALLRAGLADALSARRAARVEPPPYDARRDPTTMILNPYGIATYSTALANAVERVLDTSDFPLVLGGDCSILLGSLLALRRRGRFGLLFVDGHADFYQPDAEPTGDAASMDLALATGRGPAVVADLEGRRPLVRDDDVVLFAARDAEQAAEYGSQPVPPTIRAIPLDDIRRRGIDHATRDAIAHLDRHSLDGFWIHVDVDVLEDAIMPAVDYRMPGGLSLEELTATLRSAMASRRAVGLELTIFNPRLDADGSLARDLVRAVVAGLQVPAR